MPRERLGPVLQVPGAVGRDPDEDGTKAPFEVAQHRGGGDAGHVALGGPPAAKDEDVHRDISHCTAPTLRYQGRPWESGWVQLMKTMTWRSLWT